jgi:hypothetical protein
VPAGVAREPSASDVREPGREHPAGDRVEQFTQGRPGAAPARPEADRSEGHREPSDPRGTGALLLIVVLLLLIGVPLTIVPRETGFRSTAVGGLDKSPEDQVPPAKRCRGGDSGLAGRSPNGCGQLHLQRHEGPLCQALAVPEGGAGQVAEGPAAVHAAVPLPP